MLLSGFCVGWLVGLSTSPVVGIVVSSILGLVAGLAVALAGFEQNIEPEGPPRRLFGSLAPLGMLLVGIMFGSAFGLWARTHSWLSPSPNKVIEEWSAAGRNIDRTVIAMRLFDERYPPLIQGIGQKVEGGVTPKKDPDGQVGGIPVVGITSNGTNLFAGSLKQCDTYKANESDGKRLRQEMQNNVTSKAAKQFADEIADPKALRAAVEIFLCPEPSKP